jgi:hypothetical protein
MKRKIAREFDYRIQRCMIVTIKTIGQPFNLGLQRTSITERKFEEYVALNINISFTMTHLFWIQKYSGRLTSLLLLLNKNQHFVCEWQHVAN